MAAKDFIVKNGIGLRGATSGIATLKATSVAGTPTITIPNATGTLIVDSGVGAYSDPSWLSISKSKVGLGSVENTALSTWAGNSSMGNITTVGTLASPTINTPAIKNTYVTSSSNLDLGTIDYATYEGRLIGLTSGSAQSITINNTSVPLGTTLTFVKIGAGAMTVVTGTATARSAAGLTFRTLYSVVSMTKIIEGATDEWLIYGDTIP